MATETKRNNTILSIGTVYVPSVNFAATEAQPHHLLQQLEACFLAESGWLVI